VALGIPGLALYLVIAAVGLWRAYGLARKRRDFLSLALLGVVLVTSLQWFNGGQYAVAWIVWLAFGAVDAATMGEHRPESSEVSRVGPAVRRYEFPARIAVPVSTDTTLVRMVHGPSRWAQAHIRRACRMTRASVRCRPSNDAGCDRIVLCSPPPALAS
jgi:hypothetical protein